MQVLTAKEQAEVAAIAEAFFPPGGAISLDGPAAGVVVYVDAFLARLGRWQRLQLRALLALFELKAMASPAGMRFSAAPVADRVARLEACEQSARYFDRVAFAALRWLFTMAYVANPEVRRQMGVPTSAARLPEPARRAMGARRAWRGRLDRRVGSRVTRVERRFSTEQLIAGIEFSDWCRVLSRAQWKVSACYLHRAAWITAWSVGASAFGNAERARYARRIAESQIHPPPIIILGHWRSGTTHLHNLLGRDPNHTFPSVYQVMFPTAFLLTSRTVPALTAGLLPETRGYDNVKQGWHEAAEDEIALAKLTGLSPYLAFMFPDHAARYERYVDFLEASGAEREAWKAALRSFIAKVWLQSGGKRVVVKSCPHTARIRMLLELFPDAKFVHIHRNPFEVAASTVHMRSHTDWENFFQVPEAAFVEGRARQVALVGARIFERFLEDRALIGPENLIEVSYRDLVANPLGVLARIYGRFDLPEWDRYEAAIRPYLKSLEGYSTNVLCIDDDLASLVREHWGGIFDAYGYPTDHRL